jgi:uncharacterized protein YbbK (DUF523 family)
MPVTDGHKKITLGVSSCLIGEKVRFDGGHKQNRYILDTLGQYFSFRPFCPEMAIGLGVPRETIRLVDVAGRTEAIGNKNAELNITQALIQISMTRNHGSKKFSATSSRRIHPAVAWNASRFIIKISHNAAALGSIPKP